MHHADIAAVERQASRRATAINQAWAWAKAIEHLAHCAQRNVRGHRGTALAWLECEMAWTCEDLEDAGAWPCDLNLVSDPDPQVSLALATTWLTRLADVTVVESDGSVAVGEAQARARACLIGLTDDADARARQARAA